MIGQNFECYFDKGINRKNSKIWLVFRVIDEIEVNKFFQFQIFCLYVIDYISEK